MDNLKTMWKDSIAMDDLMCLNESSIAIESFHMVFKLIMKLFQVKNIHLDAKLLKNIIKH